MPKILERVLCDYTLLPQDCGDACEALHPNSAYGIELKTLSTKLAESYVSPVSDIATKSYVHTLFYCVLYFISVI